MAKDGTARGSNIKVGAGRKPKGVLEKAADGNPGGRRLTVIDLPEVAELEGVDVPEPSAYLNTSQKAGGMYDPEIALVLGISVNTIRSYIRRHPGTFGSKCCENCGKPLSQPAGRKKKRFCSDKCRMAWWNSHREQVRKKAYDTLTCTQCGKEFESYGNQNRKFCCRDCYLQSRHASAAQSVGKVQGVSGNSEHHAA